MKHKLILIGCGGMAKTHAGRMETLEDRVEVAATVDIDLKKAQAVSDLLPNHPPVFADYHDALELGTWCCRSSPTTCTLRAPSTASTRGSTSLRKSPSPIQRRSASP